MYSNLIIIGENVKESQYFIDNRLANTAFISLGTKSTKDDFEAKLSAFDLSCLTNIGIIFDK